jgi:hypothetical protein
MNVHPDAGRRCVGKRLFPDSGLRKFVIVGAAKRYSGKPAWFCTGWFCIGWFGIGWFGIGRFGIGRFGIGRVWNRAGLEPVPTIHGKKILIADIQQQTRILRTENTCKCNIQELMLFKVD